MSHARKRLFLSAFTVLAALLGSCAHARIGLPDLGSALPGVDTPQILDRAGKLAPNGARELLDLRRDTWRQLIRRNRAQLEAAPDGAPIRRSEIIALEPGADALASAASTGFTIMRERRLAGLGLRVVVLAAPPALSTTRALKRMRALDPTGRYDYNHLFLRSAGRALAPAALPDGASSSPARKAQRVGLVDGGVDAAHPVFAGSRIEHHGCAGSVFASAHGTAVASLLVGSAQHFHGAAPGAALFAADIYCGSESGGAADALLEAFDWLAGAAVPVINVSLVGPPNAALEAVVRVLVERGHLIVAAAGNDGPAARPMYPAAYPGVIAVSAVDSSNRVLIEACRGDHVRFAAPGADMAAAQPNGGFAAVRGTSFAAPLVAGSLVALLDAPDPAQASAAIATLQSRAIDLGRPGRDRIYGYGVVAAQLRVAPDQAMN